MRIPRSTGKDLHPVEHRGRIFTPWQSTAIVDYNSFSRPCGLLDIVSQCRRRALLLSLFQLRRIRCLSKFFNGLYFFRPCGLLDIVSQCRRRVLLLSLLQLRRIWCLSKFFNGLYFFRPRGRFCSASYRRFGRFVSCLIPLSGIHSWRRLRVLLK